MDLQEEKKRLRWHNSELKKLEQLKEKLEKDIVEKKDLIYNLKDITRFIDEVPIHEDVGYQSVYIRTIRQCGKVSSYYPRREANAYQSVRDLAWLVEFRRYDEDGNRQVLLDINLRFTKNKALEAAREWTAKAQLPVVLHGQIFRRG